MAATPAVDLIAHRVSAVAVAVLATAAVHTGRDRWAHGLRHIS